MSDITTFFAFGFTATLAVALVTTGYYYLPKLITLYKLLIYQRSQPIPAKYALDNLKFCAANEPEA